MVHAPDYATGLVIPAALAVVLAPATVTTPAMTVADPVALEVVAALAVVLAKTVVLEIARADARLVQGAADAVTAATHLAKAVRVARLNALVLAGLLHAPAAALAALALAGLHQQAVLAKTTVHPVALALALPAQAALADAWEDVVHAALVPELAWGVETVAAVADAVLAVLDAVIPVREIAVLLVVPVLAALVVVPGALRPARAAPLPARAVVPAADPAARPALLTVHPLVEPLARALALEWLSLYNLTFFF